MLSQAGLNAMDFVQYRKHYFKKKHFLFIRSPISRQKQEHFSFVKLSKTKAKQNFVLLSIFVRI